MVTKAFPTYQATHSKTSTQNSQQVKTKSKTKTKLVTNIVMVAVVVVAVEAIKVVIIVVDLIVDKEEDLIEEEVEVDLEEGIEDSEVIGVALEIEEEAEEVGEGVDLMVEGVDMEGEIDLLEGIEVEALGEEVALAIGMEEATTISRMIEEMAINSMDKEMEDHMLMSTIRIQAIALVTIPSEMDKRIQVNTLYLVLNMDNNLNMEQFSNNLNSNFLQFLELTFHSIQA